MAYIPKEHEKYDVLPNCREHGWEVFSYPDTQEIDDLLPDGEDIMPYGYDSYGEYYKDLNNYISLYGTVDGRLNQLGELLTDYKERVKRVNVKEEWSIAKYTGESTGGISGFTKNRHYYWPSSFNEPGFSGIIDDEEFTAYRGWADFAIRSSEWEIIEDPTGMVARMLGKSKKA